MVFRQNHPQEANVSFGIPVLLVACSPWPSRHLHHVIRGRPPGQASSWRPWQLEGERHELSTTGDIPASIDGAWKRLVRQRSPYAPIVFRPEHDGRASTTAVTGSMTSPARP